MTEEQWQACADPVPMLAFLRERGSERKLRLVAVAACREIGDRITDGRSREAVAVAEMFAVPPTESWRLRDGKLVQEIAPRAGQPPSGSVPVLPAIASALAALYPCHPQPVNGCP